MKKIYLSILLVATTFTAVFAQIPASFNYQAVVRNSAGEILANKTVSFRISLLQDSESGAVVYSETHKLSTNDFGLVNLKIGKGTKLSGNFSPADWGEVIFTKIEIDPAGGSSFSELATSKLSSVPYAFKAQTVVNDKVDDADHDPTNEIQKLKLTGTLLELSEGGGSVTLPTSGSGGGDNWGAQTVKTDATLTGDGTSGNPLSVVADGDGDDSNELQTLSLSDNQLTLSDGNSVTLPTSPWEETDSKVEYMGDKTVFIGDESGAGFKTKSGTVSNPPKFEISTGAKTAIMVYNETSVYPAIDIWNEEGTAATFSGNSDKTVATFENYGTGAAAEFNSSSSESTAIFDNNETGAAAEFNSSSSGPTTFFTNSSSGLAAVFNNSIAIADGTEGAGKVLTSNADGATSWETPASGGSSLWTESGSNIYRSSGNVGIGTTSPTFAMDIQASAATLNLKATGANAIVYLDRKSSTKYAYLLHRTNGINKFYVGLLGDDDYWINYGGTSTLKGLKVKTTGDVVMSNDLKVAGEVHSENTGNANMIAYAYGFVKSDGTLKASSGNVSVTKTLGTTGKYTVTITGESYSDDNYVAVFSHAHSRKSLGHEEASGKIKVYITNNSDDSYADAPFSFVIYKM